MPNCIQFTHKQSGQVESMPEVDNRICSELFGIEPDKDRYVCGWKFAVAFPLSCGRTIDQLKQDMLDGKKQAIKEQDKTEIAITGHVLEILCFLELSYDISTWVEVGKH